MKSIDTDLIGWILGRYGDDLLVGGAGDDTGIQWRKAA